MSKAFTELYTMDSGLKENLLLFLAHINFKGDIIIPDFAKVFLFGMITGKQHANSALKPL